MGKNKEKEFIKYCEFKLWNLHIEERQWRKHNKKELKKLSSKIKKIIKTKREKGLVLGSHGWLQQIGKIIFISAILREFFNSPKVPNKVWKERKWKLSKDRNRIIRDRKKRTKK